MDHKPEVPKEKIRSELKRAIRNINRNMYEWKHLKAGKTNFAITFTEVYSLVRNWLKRCLRDVVGSSLIDGIFQKSHLYVTVNEVDLCIAGIRLDHVANYYSYHGMSVLLSEILNELDFVSLTYNPDDYLGDRVSLKPELDYTPYEPTSFTHLDDFKFENPKN